MNKKLARIRRSARLRYKFRELRSNRLVVHRTLRHIYAQVITYQNSKTIASASTLEQSISKKVKYTGNKIAAAIVGDIIAKRALEKGIKNVSFDRSGFQYHGRIKALADAARKAGLQF